MAIRGAPPPDRTARIPHLEEAEQYKGLPAPARALLTASRLAPLHKAAVGEALVRIHDPSLALPGAFRKELQDRLAAYSENDKLCGLVGNLPPGHFQFGLRELQPFLNQVAKWHDFKTRHPMTAARDEAERDPWKNPARIAENARRDALAMLDNLPFMSPTTKLPNPGR
jgi:hypothetical protein